METFLRFLQNFDLKLQKQIALWLLEFSLRMYAVTSNYTLMTPRSFLSQKLHWWFECGGCQLSPGHREGRDWPETWPSQCGGPESISEDSWVQPLALPFCPPSGRNIEMEGGPHKRQWPEPCSPISISTLSPRWGFKEPETPSLLGIHQRDSQGPKKSMAQREVKRGITRIMFGLILTVT